MQAINEVFDGITVKAPEPVHGKRSKIEHSGTGIFAGIPSPIWVARYHSLQVVMRSPRLQPLANAPDRVVMAIQHESWPLWGVQFHPESFLSEYGYPMAANFLALQPKWPSTVHLPHDYREGFPRVGPPGMELEHFCAHQYLHQQCHS
jgi:anthranilate synthase component 2